MEAIKTFFDYVMRFSGEVTLARELLAKPMSDNPAELKRQLSEVEAWNARMLFHLAWANSYLDEAENRELPLKEKGLTELEREKFLASAVRQERRFRDICEGVVRAIEQRISLGQTLIRRQDNETQRHQS